jgi:hypothetical protein
MSVIVSKTTMESTVKRGSFSSLGLGVILTLAFVAFGCSSSSSSPGVDAGKDGGGTDGKTGTGGSSGTGGASSTGGTSASGGSSATGGSSASGGSLSGGAIATGGSAGASGGSSQTGGSSGATGGSGGSSNVDGGAADAGSAGSDDGGRAVDGGSSDVVDAPLPENDVPAATDDGGASSDGVPILVDLGAVDAQPVDAASVDVGSILIDAGMDSAEKIDSPASQESLDSAVDTTLSEFACPSVHMVTGGSTGNFNTTGVFCFAVCDDIAGWGASNLDGRRILVNGVEVPVPSGGSGGTLPLPAKALGTYYLFQVSAGTYPWASVNWWNSTATSCPAPDGGFGF